MNKWPLVPLIEAASPVERPEVPIPGKSYRQVGVRLWGEGAYERESLDGSETKYKTLSRVETDDIVVNKIWARNGSVAVVPENLAGCYVSGEFPTFRPTTEKLEPRWFHWLTKTQFFWDQCDEKSRGTSGKNRIRPERLLEIEIPLPTFTEQRRIVARIEAMAAKVEEANKLRQQSVKAIDSLFESKFRAVLAAAKSNVRHLPFDEIAMLERRPVVVLPDHKYQEIGTYSYGRGIFHKPPRTGFEVGDKQLYLVRSGDFILQITFAWEGAVALAGQAEDGLYGSVRYLTFRVNEDICSPRYLLVYMKTAEAINQLGKISPGSAGRNRVLNVKRLKEILVPVVPLNLQNWLTDHLQSVVDALKELQNQTAAELDALLPAIFDKAFKGDL